MKKLKSLALALCILITACFGCIAGLYFKSEALEAESLQVSDVTLYEGMDSNIAVDKYGNEYEEYVVTFEGYGEVVLRFKDGSEHKYNPYYSSIYGGNYIYMDSATGKGYSLRTNCLELQSEQHWQVGQTYAVTAEVVEEAYGPGMSSGSSYEQMSSVIISTTFNVTIEENPVEHFEISELTLYEGFDYDEDAGFNSLRFMLNENNSSLVLKDGTNCYLGMDPVIKDMNCYISFYPPVTLEEEDLTTGNTYEITAKIFRYGKYHEPTSKSILETKFNAKLEANPIESIEAVDKLFYDGLAGYMSQDWETGEEYRFYQCHPTLIVKFKDGTQEEFDGSIYYKEHSCWVESNADYLQSEEHWNPGNTYTVTATAAGFSDTFNVTIAENPVASIEVKDITIYEGLDSHLNTDWETGQEYQYYSINHNNEFTVIFKDGTKKSSSESVDGYVEVIPGSYWWLGTNINELQWDEHWSVGNTYTVTGTVAGVDGTFNVTVAENPVESIEIADMTLIDKLDGYVSGGWEGEEEFFQFNVNSAGFTVTLKNGAKLESDNTGRVWFNGHSYSLDIDNSEYDQYENHWEVGKTYELTGEFAGIKDNFNVTIAEGYESLKISGKKQLILTLTKKNGQKEIYRAFSFEEYGAAGDEDYLSLFGQLYTDSKVFLTYFEFTKDGFKIIIGAMESNILPECEFLDSENEKMVFDTTIVDTNGDDDITSDDAVYLLYHIFKPENYPVSSEQNCDFNGDGKLNSDDAIYLLYHIFLPSKYPI